MQFMDMGELIQTLEDQQKKRLAKAIADFSSKSILEYSASLWQFNEPSSIEVAFLNALRLELGRLHYSEEQIQKALASFNRYPVIQTANHVVPTLKPRPLCIEWLTSIAAPQGAITLSGHISSVPFSGAYKQGKLVMPGHEINLIPSALQDALVWNLPINEKTTAELANLSEPYKTMFAIHNDADYSAWALRTSQSIIKELIDPPIVFFDIAEVCRLYLIEALQADSPIAKLFFDQEKRKIFQAAFPKLALFITNYDSARRIKTEALWMDGEKLCGEHFDEVLSKESLCALLRDKKICPNTFLQYVILAANNIRPLGSFRTIEYVPWLFDKLRALNLFEIRDETYPMLTTGMFPAPYTNLSALDYIIKNEKLPNPTWMRELIEPMADVLLNDKANIYEITKL